jgi:hypothetical protein
MTWATLIMCVYEADPLRGSLPFVPLAGSLLHFGNHFLFY